MNELKRLRLEKAIAWAGYLIVFIGITALVLWAWMRP
jgi:polyferredoxin